MPDIKWRSWSAEAFAEAVAADKPILLNLTAAWCHWCRLMDETTYGDPMLAELINDKLVPLRVDADQHPHVQDRYIAGGWPTNAFLTPTGEVLWSGTYVEPEQFQSVAASVLGAWDERRAELKAEIERRGKALSAARSRHQMVGLVRREAADDVLTATIDAYDERNGGFGTEPKFPYVEAIELLFTHGERDNGDYMRMAEHSLDGMLAGDLWDKRHGGFYRYALAPDWTQPREEKLLSVNAALLRVYALGAHVFKRADWRSVAENIVDWADAALQREDGLWAGSDADGDVLYTNYNAQWIRALATAGARLGKAAWVSSARKGLDVLLSGMSAGNGLMYHYRRNDEAARIDFLLADAVDTARACVAVSEASGDAHYFDEARRIANAMERALWADDGGFWERPKGADEIGALRYREKPFDLNADSARLLVALTNATDERRYRALAERVLALLSPQAARYGVAGANYALAMDEFFEPSVRIVITGEGDAADALRNAALQLPLASRHVWSMAAGGRIGQLSFPLQAEPAAYIATARGLSAALTNPERLQDSLAALR